MSENKQSPSRRSFLKAAGLAATAGSLAISRSVHAAGDDVLKFGLIGCGGRGSGAANNAMDAGKNNKIVAMADVFEDQVKGARDRLKKMKPDQVLVDDDHCFTGFDGYKKVIESDCDVVQIACSSSFHPQYMTEAIEAGKHVFVEKPHGTDAPGIHTTIKACEAAKKKGLGVVSGLCWRYDKGVQETMKRVLGGEIGEVRVIQENYMRSPYRIIKRDPAWSEIEWQFRNWYHMSWLSGDDVLQSLVHSLDKASWCFGNDHPEFCYGVGGRASSFEPVHGDQFDHNAMMWEYADGRRLFGFNRAESNVYHETNDHIIGTKGTCNLLKFRIDGEKGKWRYKGERPSMYVEEQRALFDSIRAGKPLNNGDYMANSTMIGLMGRMCCYTGKKLTWDEAMASTKKSLPEKVGWDMKPPIEPGKDGLYPCPIPGVTPFV